MVHHQSDLISQSVDSDYFVPLSIHCSTQMATRRLWPSAWNSVLTVEQIIRIRTLRHQML